MNKFLKLNIIIFLLLFITNIYAQEVNVIDNKGTITKVRNNKVTTSSVSPTNPLENDVWFDTSTTPTSIKIYDDLERWKNASVINTDNQNLSNSVVIANEQVEIEITNGTNTIINIQDADADPTNENQTVSAGTGITVAQTGQDFAITNAAPDQTVAITGTGATTVTGTYPNFSIASTDNVDDADADPTNENQTVSAGTGITVAQTGQDFAITNAAPDQTVAITGTGATTVTGTYPNFSIASTDNVDDADADPTNELSDLSLTGNTLTLTNPAASATGADLSNLTISGDVTGTLSASKVEKIQNIDVSATAPVNGQLMGYNGTTSQWEPRTLNVTTETIGYIFAAMHHDGNNNTILSSQNINTTTTIRTASGRYNVRFTNPHPAGNNYAITLGVQEDSGNRDGRIIQVVTGTQNANGFNVMILTGDNAGTADIYVDEDWYFQVSDTMQVVTGVTIN